MVNKHEYIVKWIKENPYGFAVICDTNVQKTFKTTYRKVSRLVRVPFKAFANGQIRFRSSNKYDLVAGAVCDPNTMYFRKADKYLLAANQYVIEKYEPLLEELRNRGASVEVVNLDD